MGPAHLGRQGLPSPAHAVGYLRLMQAAVANGRNQAADRQLMVCVVQMFSRACTHDPQFLMRAEHLQSGACFDSLDKLFSLIKQSKLFGVSERKESW